MRRDERGDSLNELAHIASLKKQRESAEDNLVLQTEVMELIEQRNQKLNGNGNGNNGGKIKRLLRKK